jgi:hypothetical protein
VHGKAATVAVGMSSARFGRRCLDNETDRWAPRGFNFFNLFKTSSTLKIQNGYLNLHAAQLFNLFLSFACGSLRIL